MYPSVSKYNVNVHAVDGRASVKRLNYTNDAVLNTTTYGHLLDRVYHFITLITPHDQARKNSSSSFDIYIKLIKKNFYTFSDNYRRPSIAYGRRSRGRITLFNLIIKFFYVIIHPSLPLPSKRTRHIRQDLKTSQHGTLINDLLPIHYGAYPASTCTFGIIEC